MDYTITRVSTNGETIITTVVFNLVGDPLTVDIQHVSPPSVDSIYQSIVNRGISEKARIDNAASAQLLLPSIQMNTTVTF
jgi:hypothetical protein